MSSILRSLCVATLIPLFASPVLAEGDAAAGEKVFKRCAACHSVDPAKGSKVGPNLHGVVGRKTGSIEGFAYSNKMAEIGAAGHVWTPEELDLYLENPKKMVPGGKMAFAGLKKPEERANVVAYLATFSDAPVAPAEAATGTSEPAADAPAAAATTTP